MVALVADSNSISHHHLDVMKMEPWRKTCASCGAYIAPYCYGIELQAGSDADLEKPYKTEADEWCTLWRKERKTEWNGRKLVRS